MATKPLAKKIARLCFLKKATDVVLLDIRKLSDVTDFFILCSGDSDIQVRAIANSIIDSSEKIGLSVWHKEGLETGNWAIIDFVDVVVHVFQKQARSYYNLEKLWSDASKEKIEESKPKPITKKTKTTKTKPTARKK